MSNKNSLLETICVVTLFVGISAAITSLGSFAEAAPRAKAKVNRTTPTRSAPATPTTIPAATIQNISKIALPSATDWREIDP